MGLLSDVLLLPVTGPVRGLRFIAEQLKEQVVPSGIPRGVPNRCRPRSYTSACSAIWDRSLRTSTRPRKRRSWRS